MTSKNIGDIVENEIFNFKDMFTINSLFFIVITTSISVLISFFGTSFIQELSTNKAIQLGFNVIVFLIYLIALAMYYLHWSFKSIVLLILAISTILTVGSFFIIYFGAEACEQVETMGFKNFIHYIVIMFLFLIFYLGIHNRHDYYGWSLYDTGRFSFILILARYLYYLIDKYDLGGSYKNILNIILLIVFYYTLKRIYNVWSQTKLNIKSPFPPPASKLNELLHKK